MRQSGISRSGKPWWTQADSGKPGGPRHIREHLVDPGRLGTPGGPR